jgi:hypothetical protein
MIESGVVSGILGAEPEAAAEGTVPETALDPTAAALAAEAAKSDPGLAKKASAYFDTKRIWSRFRRSICTSSARSICSCSNSSAFACSRVLFQEINQ